MAANGSLTNSLASIDNQHRPPTSAASSTIVAPSATSITTPTPTSTGATTRAPGIAGATTASPNGATNEIASSAGAAAVAPGPGLATAGTASTANPGQNTNSNSVDVLSKTNLYIRGLHAKTKDQDLYVMCCDFGLITSTKAILEKTTGTCRGYGFVEFAEPKSAELAVQQLTKSGIHAQMAKISPTYMSRHHHHHHNNNNNNTNHHHHHQNQRHHPHHLNHQNNNYQQNPNNSNPNNNSNQNQYQSNNNIVDQGNMSSSSSGNNHADPTNLYIANLPPNMSEPELENLLSSYGPVVSSRILRDQSNIPRGVGFARMESRDKCEQVIQHLNGRPCKGWKEPLLVKFADGGTKKRHHNSNHQHHHQHHKNQNPHHKAHQGDTRCRDSSNTSDLDLAMIGPMSYPRIQPVFFPNVGANPSYPAQLVPPTSAAPQWIHPGGPGPAYVIPQQMIQAGAMGSNQAAAIHYGHIPQLNSQMQGLQIAHPGGAVGGYLPPPQHQWSPEVNR